MKRAWWIVGLLLLGALMWGATESKSDNIVGYLGLASGTTDSTVAFVNQISNFSVCPETQDITVDLLMGTGGAVSDITVKAGDVLTMGGLSIYSITIDRTNATAVDLYWWY